MLVKNDNTDDIDIDIDIVGRACRLPGSSNVQEFWELLQQGRCAVSEIGPDRWSKSRHYHPRQGEPGKSYSFAAGVLDDIWGFDPGVFNISPREAEQMDPQQRLLLQVVWEALEDAGIPPTKIAGGNVGVFVGASGLDHGTWRMFDPATTDAYFMTGNTLSLLSNRISYIFDFHGPSYTVDTACSSSLVALHAAYQALVSGQVDTAIVAGVNALLTPFPFIGFAAAHMLSPEGLCRPFDANGMGYVRAEGCVAMILQRRDIAESQAHTSHGRIVNAGINSDGRTVGVALPSAQFQAKLLDQVYREAGVQPEQLAFVEAHGTGTLVGDPAEAQALGETLGQKRTKPLPIGSVKSNIGHLEPASGLAGLLKASLAFEHDLLPASLHFDKPNPDIPFDDLNLRVASKSLKLKQGSGCDYAGISTFGFGGTNAHVILQRPSKTTPAPVHKPKPDNFSDNIVLLSAQSSAALKALAGRYGTKISGLDDSDVPALAAAAFYRRDRLSQRLAVTGNTAQEIAANLDAFAQGKPAANLVTAQAIASNADIAYVYSGNGSQWAGMGKLAFANNLFFRAQFEKIDKVFGKIAGWSVIEMLHAGDLDDQLLSTKIAQPLLFAIQVALTNALRVMGLEPSVVLGHSVGEIAAAYASGALSLKDASNVIHKRSLHQEIARALGTMAAVMLPESDTKNIISSGKFTQIEIAAINSKRSVTISGPRKQVEMFARMADEQDVTCKLLDIDYPFHSAIIDPVREPLLQSLAKLKTTKTDIAFISTVTGEQVDGKKLDADYWWNNVRQPVRFAEAMASAVKTGARIFVEIGPRAVLRQYIKDGLDAQDVEGVIIHNFHNRDYKDIDPVRLVFANALASGARITEGKLYQVSIPENLTLPGYPWQNKPYQGEMSKEALSLLSQGRLDHPLIGWRTQNDSPVWRTHLDPHILPYLADHKVNGKIVVPGSAFVEMAIAVGRQWLGSDKIEIVDMDIVQPMMLSNDHVTEVKLEISPDTGNFEIAGRERLSQDEWQVHAVCRIAQIPRLTKPDVEPFKFRADHDRVERDRLYNKAERFGLDYGPSFKKMLGVKKIDGSTLEVWLDVLTQIGGEEVSYNVHPVALDACFHGLIKVYPSGKDEKNEAYIPIRFGEYRVFEPGVPVRMARIVLINSSSRSINCNLELFGENGELVATLREARFRAVSLVERAHLSKLAYRHDSETIALPGDFQSATAPGIAQIVVHAKKLSPGNARQNEEAKRLIEAASHRAAYDAVQSINQNKTKVDIDKLIGDGDLSAEQRGFYCALLMVLEDADLATMQDDRWSLAPDSGLPAVRDILLTVLDEHPDRLSECTLLSRATAILTDVLSGKFVQDDKGLFTSATLEYFGSSASGAQALIEAITGLVGDAAASWEKDRPLRILEIGLGAGALTRSLAPLVAKGRGRLVAADTNKKTVDRLRMALLDNPAVKIVEFGADGSGVAEEGPFDLLVSANGLHGTENCDDVLTQARAHLAPGALLIAAEPVPDAFHDVVFGLDGSWFNRSASAEFPLGALRAPDEWLASVKMAGFYNAKALPIATDDGTATLLLAKAEHQVDIVRSEDEADASAVEAPRVPTLLIAGDDGEDGRLAEALETTLHNHKHHVIRIKPAASNVSNGAIAIAPEFPESWREILKNAEASTGVIPDIIHLDGAYSHNADPQDALRYRLATMMALFQALGSRKARIWIVAPGGARATDIAGEIDPVQSGVWAFARTATNEYANTDIRLLDFEADLDIVDTAERIAAMVHVPGIETEVVLRHNSCQALRVRRGRVNADTDRTPADACVLDFASSGALNQLHWRAKQRIAPKSGEVEIEIVATGLNFRDVMWTLGMLPEEALEDGFAGPTLGFECSGKITAVGKGVKDFVVGDSVIGFAPACFSSHVSVSANALSPVPRGTDLMAAATIPVAFLTAYYALHHLGKLEQDQWVLIHGGAGGVGLAALQVALWRGARIITTAGSPEKRQFLEMLGANHVFDSRSLEFYDDVLQVTDGKGVDVVLNSLSGEAMERSIKLVRPFGRFLELGKRDYYANTKVGLRPFRRNVSYFGIDADQLLIAAPKLSNQLFSDLVDLFENGTFTALPYRKFAADQVVDAYRLMQQSGHIGKIIITPPNPGTVFADQSKKAFEAEADGAHIVVGGLGGFGLKVAEWLGENGARTIILTSRTGVAGEEVKAEIERLNNTGLDIRVETSDVTDRQSLDKLLDDLREQMPIKGIVHAAMVIDDGLIQNLDPDRLTPVLAPKVLGVDNLDQATRSDKLDYFVLFSSVSTLIGNPGQASYVAANAYMEGVAHRRRTQGLPALAVGWGAITDVGYIARNKDVGEMIASRTGGIPFSAREALAMLGELLAQDDGAVSGAAITVAPMDWSVAAQDLNILNTRSFALIAREAASAGAKAGGQMDIAKLIDGLDDREARDVVAKYLAGEVSHLLRLPEDDINLQRPLADIGIDSLMVFELRTSAQKSLGITIPIGSIADGITLNDIAGKIVDRARNSADQTPNATQALQQSLADQHVGDGLEVDKFSDLTAKLEKHEESLGKIL